MDRETRRQELKIVLSGLSDSRATIVKREIFNAKVEWFLLGVAAGIIVDRIWVM